MVFTGYRPNDKQRRFTPLPNAIFNLDLCAGEIAIYAYLMYCENRKTYQLNSESVNGILDSAAVVVDGAYIEDLNDNSVLRGSSNQQIHILNPDHEDSYRKYLANTQNQIQNFNTVDGVVSVGIHRKTFTRPYSDNA